VRNKVSQFLAGASVLLALGAALFLALWPYYYRGESVSVDGRIIERTHASLIEENGVEVLPLLLLPMALSLSAWLLLFLKNQWTKVFMWAAAILLLVFSFFTGLTVGAFYLPAALALLLAAIAATRRHRPA